MAVLHVVEGEKCADALWELQLVATTSQGGSGRASETDWAPAALFEQVCIWQDVDATDSRTGVNPGVKYAQTVAELIWKAGRVGSGQQQEAGTADGAGAPNVAGGTPAPQCPAIVIVDLRPAGLTDGQDVYDWIAAQRLEGKDDAAVRAGLEELATQFGKRWLPRVAVEYPNQPRPYTPKRSDLDGRPSITNFEFKDITKADGVTEKKMVALPIHRIRERIQLVTAGV